MQIDYPASDIKLIKEETVEEDIKMLEGYQIHYGSVDTKLNKEETVEEDIKMLEGYQIHYGSIDTTNFARIHLLSFNFQQVDRISVKSAPICPVTFSIGSQQVNTNAVLDTGADLCFIPWVEMLKLVRGGKPDEKDVIIHFDKNHSEHSRIYVKGLVMLQGKTPFRAIIMSSKSTDQWLIGREGVSYSSFSLLILLLVPQQFFFQLYWSPCRKIKSWNSF